MTAALDIFLRLAAWLLLAPLLPGIINKVKAWVAAGVGRRCCNYILTSPSSGAKASS